MSGNRPAFRRSVWKPENMAIDAQNKEKNPIGMIQTASGGVEVADKREGGFSPPENSSKLQQQ
ncbi:hypothetical protein [Neisseria meningitidis]|uniref:hypothetical protein n=1 Tax=Neisseria meningitidis TaxID=487 RepID=UPI0015D64768|nr:hypothetical protein [Neisseria meningitidis]